MLRKVIFAFLVVGLIFLLIPQYKKYLDFQIEKQVTQLVLTCTQEAETHKASFHNAVCENHMQTPQCQLDPFIRDEVEMAKEDWINQCISTR